MAIEGWHPKRGDHVRIRATGIEATAMRFDGTRVRVHYDAVVTSQTSDEVKASFLSPVYRTSLRPPEWFALDELEPVE